MNNYLVIQSLISGNIPDSNEIHDAKLSAFDVEMCRKRLYFDSLRRLHSGSMEYTEFVERTHRIDENSKMLLQQV